MKKIKITQKVESLGISLLLISSFYFYEFSYLSLPSFKTIITELLKIFIIVLFLNLLFLNLYKIKFKNFLLSIYLAYVLIFIIKLIFNASGQITLHLFLEKFYDIFFNWDPYAKPFLIKILSYLTPFLLIFLSLFFLRKKFEKIKKFFSILGILVSFVVISDLVNIYKNEINSKQKEYKKVQIDNNKKVLWILYDALDPEYLEKKVKGKKVFQNLINLKDNGVYFQNAYSPGKFTNDSAPAQLMGINIIDEKSKHRIKIFTDLAGEEIPFKFETTVFEKMTKQGLDVSLMSSVLEYCSSYLRSNKWKICKDTISENKKVVIFNDALIYFFNIIYKTQRYFNKLSKNFKKEDNEFNRQTINFKDLNFEKFKKLEFDNSNFFSDQSKLFNVKNIMDTIDKSNMVFLHIYNPHLHPDNKFLQDIFNLKANVKEEYFLRYLYVDFFTKKIVNEIKKKELDNFLIIISSDHWWRGKPNIKEDYVGNSFLLVKNLSDNFNYIVEKKSTTIIIPSLIEKFFKNELNSNKEFFDFSNNSKIKVHVKKERF